MAFLSVHVHRIFAGLFFTVNYYGGGMITRFRTALYNAVSGQSDQPAIRDDNNAEKSAASGKAVDGKSGKSQPLKFPYTRPHFLQLNSEDEIQVSADHVIRPIIVPRDIQQMPWHTGYAETINAGKSLRNEDQARIHTGYLRLPSATANDDNSRPPKSVKYIYFGVFDGHAGSGAAVAAANQLHRIIHDKLQDIAHHLLAPPSEGSLVHESSLSPGFAGQGVTPKAMWFPDRDITKDSLVVGALESAFWDMDTLIREDRTRYKLTGGCTATVALFLLGKVFVANAGDSRAVLCRSSSTLERNPGKCCCHCQKAQSSRRRLNNANSLENENEGWSARPLSNDFTPETETDRVRHLAWLHPELLGGEYTHLDFCRRPLRRDVGNRVLYRDAHMTGWAYKTVTPDDLKFPIVYGEGKRSRVLATIGVTRGFGDHDLRAQYSQVAIKPFLSPQPEVTILDLCEDVDPTDLSSVIGDGEWSDGDVVVLATDGLWDITSNNRASGIVRKCLIQFEEEKTGSISRGVRHKYRYVTAAQDLVLHSRGKFQERSWRTSDGKSATVDDISVFVIPVLPHRSEHIEWLRLWESAASLGNGDHSNSTSVTDPIAVPTVNGTGDGSSVELAVEASPSNFNFTQPVNASTTSSSDC